MRSGLVRVGARVRVRVRVMVRVRVRARVRVRVRGRGRVRGRVRVRGRGSTRAESTRNVWAAPSAGNVSAAACRLVSARDGGCSRRGREWGVGVGSEE